jgi:hypothetical protein
MANRQMCKEVTCQVSTAIVLSGLIVFPALAQEPPSPKTKVRFASEVVRPAQFTPANLARIGARYLSPEYELVIVWFWVGKADWESIWGPDPRTTWLAYSQWLQMFREYHPMRKRVARMVSLGESTVLQMRTDAREICTRVVSGRNFLLMEGEGVSAEIVDISYRSPPPWGRSGQVFLHVKAGRADDDRVPELVSRTFESVDDIVWAHIREDVWFGDDPGSPLFSPFVFYGDPPSPEAWRELPQRLRRISR